MRKKVAHRYVDFISKDECASKRVITPKYEFKLHSKYPIKIPQKSGDKQTFKTDTDLSQEEMLEKNYASKQNHNNLLKKKQGENND